MVKKPTQHKNKQQKYLEGQFHQELEQVCKSFFDSYLKLTGFVLGAKTNLPQPEAECDFDESRPTSTDNVHHAMYRPENPGGLYVYIPGPILTLNQSLRLRRPQDRYHYGNIKGWWLNQIKAALVTLPFEARRKPFQPALIIISESTKTDLDNIAIKSLIDALQNTGVIRQDDPENCPAILILKDQKQEEALEIIVTDNQQAIASFRNKAQVLFSQITTNKLHNINAKRKNITPDTPFS